MSISQQNREIEIITPLGADVLLLREINVTEELGRLFSINVEMGSTEDINFEDLLGQNVSIRLNNAQGKRFFNGYVSSISQGVSEGRYARYYATIHPWLWFLTRTADCRIFQDKTIPEIIKDVLREQGYSDIEDRLEGNFHRWDYCVQYRETDFNFISRLMEQEGIYYYFKHEQGKHTLCLANGLSSHDKMPGCYDIPYYPPDQAVVRESECISGWNIVKQLQTGTYCLNDYDFEHPKADLHVNSNIIRDHDRASFEIYDYPGEYVKNDEGSNYAKFRIQELQCHHARMQGNGNVRGLICGGLFKLSLFPRKDQNREYLVTSVTHNVRIDSFDAIDSSSNHYSNSFSVVESKTTYRSARLTPKPFVQGPQTAVVVGPAGEEIYTDKYGRVKVQFHWDRLGKKNENSSCWIRVSHPWAGKGWGSVSIPRIGQEVIVDFLEGDPDQPIITGRVYNADLMPPYDLPAGGVVSGIKSNTHKGKGYNELSMDDTAGKEKITIHGQHDMTSTIENDLSMTVVSGNETRTIKAGTQSVTVKGNTSLTVQAGDRIVNVTGSYKCDTTKEINLQAPTKITLTCGGSTIVMEPGKITLTAGGGASLTLDSTAKMVSTAGSSVLLDGKATMSGVTESMVEAPKSTLSGGGSTTVADPSGVAVTGPKISLNG